MRKSLVPEIHRSSYGQCSVIRRSEMLGRVVSLIFKAHLGPPGGRYPGLKLSYGTWVQPPLRWMSNCITSGKMAY